RRDRLIAGRMRCVSAACRAHFARLPAKDGWRRDNQSRPITVIVEPGRTVERPDLKGLVRRTAMQAASVPAGRFAGRSFPASSTRERAIAPAGFQTPAGAYPYWSRKLRILRLRDGCLSLRSAFASIWRIRSRVTEN